MTSERTGAGRWIALLAMAAIGETIGVVLAVIFGVTAFSQTDPAERARLWTTAGWWLLGALACTAVSACAIVRLLRIVAKQAPGSLSDPAH
jgi:hypothetical protein